MPPLSPHRGALVRLLLATAVVSVGAAACAGERPTLADTPEETTSTTATTVPAVPPTVEVAEAINPTIDVFATAEALSPSRQLVAGVDTSVDTIPIVFRVRRTVGDRLEVELPVAPPLSTAWVAAEDVTVTSVALRIEIDLGAHLLRVLEGDVVRLDQPIGIGLTDRPLPGTYFLHELLAPPDPDGPYGSFAYGLSGYPNVIDGFDHASGVVGIHGTDDASLVGGDTPTGSVRLPNEVIEQMVNEIGLPLGTPVEVRA